MRHLISIINKRAESDNKFSREVQTQIELDSGLIINNPWSPVILKEGANWLNEDNFESISVLAYDIDNDEEKLSIKVAIDLLKPYKFIIGTSRNHMKEKFTASGKSKGVEERYRVILFLEKTCYDRAEYKTTWSYWAEKLGLSPYVDSTMDLARFFYACSGIVHEQDGIKLSLQSAAALPSKPKLKIVPAGKDRLKRATIEFLCQLDDGRNWHTRFIDAAIDLKKCGYSMEEAEQELCKASPEGELDAEHDIPQLKDVYDKREPHLQGVINWPDRPAPTPRNPFPKPTPNSVRNIEHLLINILGYNLMYDLRSNKIVIEHKFGQHFGDAHFNSFMYHCLSHGLTSNQQTLQVVVTQKAMENKYDPFYDIFFSKEWDGVDRFEALFNTLVLDDSSIPDREVHLDSFKRWLRAIAAKFKNRDSQNVVLTLVAAQGAGKSRWLSRLAEPWLEGYKEGAIDPSNKDHAISLTEKFLWCISELDAVTNNKDANALKDILTRTVVSERRPYARLNTEAYAICTFCASVNSTSFLFDMSGSRRFIPIQIKEAKADHNIDMQQVYAQAMAEYEAGKDWYFNRADIVEREKLNEVFEYKSAFDERFDEGVESGDDALSIHEIVDILRRDSDSSATINSKTFRVNLGNAMLKKGIKFQTVLRKKKYLVNKAKLEGVK